MKRLLAIFVIILAAGSFVFSQSKALLNEIELTKKEAAGEGYTLIDYGGFETNYDYYMYFDPTNFYGGNIYYVVVYLEGCSYCDVGMIFYSYDKDGYEELTPKITRAGGVVRAIYGVKQTLTSNGQIRVYAKSSSKVYTYGLLFKKLDL